MSNRRSTNGSQSRSRTRAKRSAKSDARAKPVDQGKRISRVGQKSRSGAERKSRSRSKRSRTELAPAATSRDLLPEPVLLATERRGAYFRLDKTVRAAVQPRDSIEEIWVRDIVDLVWDSQRLRRVKAAYWDNEAASEAALDDVSTDVAYAKALSNRLSGLDRLDGLIASMEARRATVLREIDRRRAAITAQGAGKSSTVEDAEFEEVPSLETGSSRTRS